MSPCISGSQMIQEQPGGAVRLVVMPSGCLSTALPPPGAIAAYHTHQPKPLSSLFAIPTLSRISAYKM